jgi:hypothetical protein
LDEAQGKGCADANSPKDKGVSSGKDSEGILKLRWQIFQ